MNVFKNKNTLLYRLLSLLIITKSFISKNRIFKLSFSKALNCSPTNKNNKGSCLNRPLLEKVAKVVSNLEECGKIDCSITCEKILHKNICKELKKISGCDNEACWMTIKSLMDSLSSKERDDFKFSFKPVMPETWKKEPNKYINGDFQI